MFLAKIFALRSMGIQLVPSPHPSKSIPIGLNHVTNEPRVNEYTAPNTTRTDAVTSEPVAASCDAPSIGQNQWRQLKRVQILVFADQTYVPKLKSGVHSLDR